MTIKGIIFDLDGTLLDTLVDISEAMNYALRVNGFSEHPHEEYRYFVGSGVDVLIERVLKNTNATTSDFQNVKETYLKRYEQTQHNKTKPYEGILELINELTIRNIKLAILSNKPHADTLTVVNNYFDINKFIVIFGARKGVDIKPSPDSVYEILELFDLAKDEVLYVGDTDIDMKTANNAGLVSVGVSWGFRTPEELRKNNAKFIIDKPSDLLKIIK